ncbi:MAG: hypothetical protein K5762_04045 [Bacilli bacterium]|nr:hypothetical protein [Bacilli bacterium]
MNKALVFQNGKEEIVTARDVLDNWSIYKNKEFSDPEENFRVKFIKDCKGHKGPYFRLYLSREDYNKLSPERKNRYDILKDQRHYQESAWHNSWEEKFSQYGYTEHYIHIKDCPLYKRADAYIPEVNTCVEFQHSYIANDFEERNNFYKSAGINIIWLYDLTKQTLKFSENKHELLENNSNGFFKISEVPDNLKDNYVFIQVRGNKIYRVDELKRKEINNPLQSTIRYFNSSISYSIEEFIQGVITGQFLKENNVSLHSIKDLWDKSYSMMIVNDQKKQL